MGSFLMFRNKKTPLKVEGKQLRERQPTLISYDRMKIDMFLDVGKIRKNKFICILSFY